MQQTPTQTHTLDSLKQALVTHKPQLEPIIDTVFAKLAQPTTEKGVESGNSAWFSRLMLSSAFGSVLIDTQSQEKAVD